MPSPIFCQFIGMHVFLGTLAGTLYGAG
jgi:hypothetical protein